MRRFPPNVQHAVTGILSALAVTAIVAATRSPDGGSATLVATVGGNFVPDSVEVALVLSGEVGQYAGMCASLALAGTDSLGGTDSLTGKLGRDGDGPVASDEDVMYRGSLARKTHVKACGTMPSPTEDQVTMCFATLVGSARMNVELEVNEGNRGAYIKMTADTKHPVTKSISGCPEPAEWLKDYYPDGASGISIETVPSGLLRVGKTYTEAGVSLKVIR
jgi:hypothetical protein